MNNLPLLPIRLSGEGVLNMEYSGICFVVKKVNINNYEKQKNSNHNGSVHAHGDDVGTKNGNL